MIILETELNFIRSQSNTAPQYVCAGECKKVWWNEDIEQPQSAIEIIKCKACSGNLSSAKEGDNYKIHHKIAELQPRSKASVDYMSIIKQPGETKEWHIKKLLEL